MEGIKRISKDQANIEYITSNFANNRFELVINDRRIVYQVLKMTDSCIIFINDKGDMHLSSLYLALLSRFDNRPIATRLLGDFTQEESSKSLVSRLSKKLNKTVFVSCNIEDDRILMPLVEKRLYEEIKENPDLF